MLHNVIYRYIPGDGLQSFKSDHIIKNQGTTGYTKGNIHEYPKVESSNLSPNYQDVPSKINNLEGLFLSLSKSCT